MKITLTSLTAFLLLILPAVSLGGYVLPPANTILRIDNGGDVATVVRLAYRHSFTNGDGKMQIDLYDEVGFCNLNVSDLNTVVSDLNFYIWHNDDGCYDDRIEELSADYSNKTSRCDSLLSGCLLRWTNFWGLEPEDPLGFAFNTIVDGNVSETNGFTASCFRITMNRFRIPPYKRDDIIFGLPQQKVITKHILRMSVYTNGLFRTAGIRRRQTFQRIELRHQSDTNDVAVCWLGCDLSEEIEAEKIRRELLEIMEHIRRKRRESSDGDEEVPLNHEKDVPKTKRKNNEA